MKITIEAAPAASSKKRVLRSTFAILALALTMAGISFPGTAQAATNGAVWEAASSTGWRDQDPSTISGASATAAMSMNGVKYIYTIINGDVWEADSAHGWKNYPTTTIHGATAIAVTNRNGIKFIYTLINGEVWEAASSNGWKNYPTTTIHGATAIAATSMNGVNYVYTLINGDVWEADSAHGWKNYPTTTIHGATAIAAMSMNGVKYVYTLINGQAWEADSAHGWKNYPTTTISGASSIAAMNMNNVKYIYTIIGGQAWEAASSNGWKNYPTATVFNASAISAMNMSGVKYIYTLKSTLGQKIVSLAQSTLNTSRQSSWPTGEWCAAYASYILQQAGSRTPSYTAADSFRTNSQNFTWINPGQTPQAGDLALWDKSPYNGVADHVNIVTSVSGPYSFSIIGGNQGGGDGTVNPGTVTNGTYGGMKLMGFARPIN